MQRARSRSLVVLWRVQQKLDPRIKSFELFSSEWSCLAEREYQQIAVWIVQVEQG